MASETQDDFTATGEWQDLVAAIPATAGADVTLQNLDTDLVQVVFGGAAEPAGKAGTLLRNLGRVEGNAAHIWVRARKGTAQVSVALRPATDGKPPLAAGTDRSGAIGAGGAAQVMAAANTGRRGLRIFNNSGDVLWVSEVGAAAANGAGSVQIESFGFYEVVSSRAISIFGATTGQKFTAVET